MDKLISEILGFFLVAVLMILLFIFGTLFYHVQQYNQFKNQCIEVVQRAGQANGDIPNKLDNIARNYYAGYGGTPDFQVETDGHASDPQEYGKPIKFYIHPRILTTTQRSPISIFGFRGSKHIDPGYKLITVDSQVRKNSQTNIN